MCRLVVHLQQVRQRLDRRLAVLRDAEQSQYLVSMITRLHSRLQVAPPPGCLLVHRATVVLAMEHAVWVPNLLGLPDSLPDEITTAATCVTWALQLRATYR